MSICIYRENSPCGEELVVHLSTFIIIAIHQWLIIAARRLHFFWLTMASSAMARFTLVFYVPPGAVLSCKNAIFKAGAGRYPGPGNYTECCWSTSGTGQFRPGDAANPHIGKVGELEETPEVRIEAICVGEDITRRAVAALKE